MALDPVKLEALLVPGVASVAEEIQEKLKTDFPLLMRAPDGLQIQGPDRRVAFGIGQVGGKRLVALLVENDDSWSFRRAKELQEQNPGSVVLEVTGRAHSSRPSIATKKKKANRLVPGLSIGHYGGFPGTMGCFVEIKGGDGDYVGVVSASHVLSINNAAKTGDAVLHPGHPDGPRTLRNKIGEIGDFTFLSHYQDADGELPRNIEDIAVVRIVDEPSIKYANSVPNPKNIDRKTKIKGVTTADNLFELIGEPVYKIGRTSGFTSGVLEFTNIQRLPIRLPNGKIYLFEEIACVKSQSKKPFSEPGDSGSLVYTAEGYGIGLVIGGSDKYSFVSPLSSCLDAISAELLI